MKYSFKKTVNKIRKVITLEVLTESGTKQQKLNLTDTKGNCQELVESKKKKFKLTKFKQIKVEK